MVGDLYQWHNTERTINEYLGDGGSLLIIQEGRGVVEIQHMPFGITY